MSLLCWNLHFTAEDVIKGNGAYPETLNSYAYCMGNPMSFVDLNGKIGYYFYDPEMFVEGTVDIDTVVKMDKASLEKQYQTDIEIIKMDSADGQSLFDFQAAWDAMDDSNGEIEVVVIMTHANNEWFVTDSIVNTVVENGEEKLKRSTVAKMKREDIEGLSDKNIGTLYLLGCNMGLTDTRQYSNSLASTFYTEKARKSIGTIIAADGSIMQGYSEGKRTLCVIPGDYHDNGDAFRFKKYEIVDGSLVITEIEDISVYWGEISSLTWEDFKDEDGCKGVKNGKGKNRKKK